MYKTKVELAIDNINVNFGAYMPNISDVKGADVLSVNRYTSLFHL